MGEMESADGKRQGQPNLRRMVFITIWMPNNTHFEWQVRDLVFSIKLLRC